MNNEIDQIDRRLIGLLMRNGRATWADLAEELGLTAPAIAQRVRRLEERGVIRQFAAWVDPSVVAPVQAYVTVSLDRPGRRDAWHRRVRELEAVQECSRIAGESDYLLKVRCGSWEALDELLSTTLPAIPGVSRPRASVVLASIKDTPVLPLAGLAGAD